MFGLLTKTRKTELDPAQFCKQIHLALGANATESEFKSQVRKANEDFTAGTEKCIVSDKYVLTDVIYPDMANRMWNWRMIAKNPFNEIPYADKAALAVLALFAAIIAYKSYRK